MLKQLWCGFYHGHTKRKTREYRKRIDDILGGYEEYTSYDWVCTKCGKGGTSKVDFWGNEVK